MKRFGSRVTVVVVAMTALLLVAIPDASALNTRFVEYGQLGNCSHAESAQYDFESQPEWNTTLKGRFDLGFDAWFNDIENYKGQKILSEGGNGWNARWDDFDNTNKHAETKCFAWVNDITFNDELWDEYYDNTLNLNAVAAHEWGHAIGLGHVGYNDADTAQSSLPPTMATCTSHSGRASLSHDDESAVHVRHSAEFFSSGYRNITSNSSFEESESSGKEYWQTQNLNSFYRSSSGGGVDTSTYFAYTKAIPGVTNGAIFQDTYVTAKNGERYLARGNYKKRLSSDFGTIKITIKVRSGTHSSSGCGGLSTTSMGSSWVYKNATCTPSNNWGYCTTSTVYVNDDASNRVHEARIVFYNRMQNNIDGGTNTYVRTDRDRAGAQGYSS